VRRLEKPIRGKTERAVDCYIEARVQMDQAHFYRQNGRKADTRSAVNQARWWVRRSRAADRRNG
jgi:hypothetical protein